MTRARPARSRSARVWRVAAACAYVALVLVSRGRPPAPPAVEPGDRAIRLPAFTGRRALESRTVNVAFGDRHPETVDRPPIVLLHGSPGSQRELGRLAALLAERRRVIAPDLPGFGASDRAVPDYSIAAHAAYVVALLDALRVPRAHLVGYSMGGGVALNLADMAPDRVASLTLLSSIGAQEFELLGNYHLNHAVHGVQLAGLWALREGTPHMGRLDGAMLGVPYARNFFDSDQRPLRGILSRLEMPVLILHGTHDPLVPFEAAREHARLVPQSELVVFSDDHFMPFRSPAALAGPIDAFTARADAGRALTRATAPRERIRAAVDGPPVAPAAAVGVARVVFAALLAVATFVSEDAATLGAGLLVAHGRLGWMAAVLGCVAGIVLGDLLSWCAGRRMARSRVLRAVLSRRVGEEALDRAADGLSARGTGLILTRRLLPGARLPIGLAAGALGLSAWRFAAAAAVSAALWTPAIVAAGAGASRWLMRVNLATGSTAASTVGLLVSLTVAVRLVRRLFDYRSRRLLLSTWRRSTRWEYWPPWFFYLPVLAAIGWLMLRYRSVTVCTAANPGIAGGGVIGESKADILRRVAAVSADVAPFVVLRGDDAPGDRRDAAESFAARHGLPAVLKPDQGQRGAGVLIVDAMDDLRRAAERSVVDTILQRYVPGQEFGLFYYRRPAEAGGHLFAITEKRLPTVIGDGRRTLERLILGDARALAMAPAHLSANRGRLAWVPPAGLAVTLTELGTHSRGAIFLDGAPRRTAALDAAVDRIGRAVDGFYFGRFDVRAASVTALQEGRFDVIELNGVTSEATNIYDPSTRLWTAYGVLIAQWRLAFEIGAANVARGVRPATVAALVGLLRSYRRAARHHLASSPRAAEAAVRPVVGA